MNSLDANTRNTKSKGDVRSLRLAGDIPGIIYGGPEENQYELAHLILHYK